MACVSDEPSSYPWGGHAPADFDVPADSDAPDVDPSDLDPSDVEASDFDPAADSDPRAEFDASTGAGERWAIPEPTGVPGVDAAVAGVAALDRLPTAEHVASYEVAHRHLQDALADLDGA